jgi:UDP-N-acetyl-D-galactosamine dehydrogenase
LTHKAQEIGYHPEMILAGRRINDNMSLYVASEVNRLMSDKRILINGARVLVLGITFKENCPDIRNSKVADVVRELEKFGAKVDVHDPWASPGETRHEYGIEIVSRPKKARYDAVVLAVSHDEFRKLGIRGVRALCKSRNVVYDIKHVFPAAQTDGRL